MKTDIEVLKRERPDLFDEQDVPDITDIDHEMTAALLCNAPPKLKEFFARNLSMADQGSL